MNDAATPPWISSAWLDALPSKLEECARRCHVVVGSRLGHGNTSRVFECVDERGRARVLKLVAPEARSDLEAAALRVWDGSGAVTLLDEAADLGALLLARVEPGLPLPPGDDAAAAEAIAPTLMALHAVAVPRDHRFPSQADFIETWRERALSSAEPGTAGLRRLEHAMRVARMLSAATARRVLLHGDFIDKNLLRGGKGYVAVDPIPQVGDPASDIGFYAAYHPPARAIATRARELAKRSGIDAERAARWAAVWAVGEATQTWRADSSELQTWVDGAEAAALLEI